MCIYIYIYISLYLWTLICTIELIVYLHTNTTVLINVISNRSWNQMKSDGGSCLTLFFLEVVLANLDPLPLHRNFWISLSIYFKNFCRHFDWDSIECIHKFGENIFNIGDWVVQHMIIVISPFTQIFLKIFQQCFTIFQCVDIPQNFQIHH